MGKQKGERSKNRPSSSSLAASLLPTGASAIGFGGYLGSSRIEPPSSSAEESTSVSDVDSEVAQHLKRLGRKDPTTKIKALTSLDLLFKQKSAEEIGQIVPQWAFEYKRLLLDYNREVRRATHGVMTSLAVTVRKGLLPHLKSLMGPWWFSQFDPVPEVSQAAKRSLEAAFPASARRLDALMLCVNEIFLYLDENLKLTPQAMSDKATPMDELEDMYQRVISSSLLALATLIDILLGMPFQGQESESATTEQKLASRARSTTISAAEKMFSVHKFFLEFYRSKSPAVRSATYSVLTSFTKHIPHVYSEGSMKTVSAAILGVFLEKDASCHSSMWDMLLVYLRKFPDSWSKTNVQKGVLPRLWNFLRHGCYGSQQLSYPALVLFLESVPPKAVTWEEFIFNFFDSLWAGRNPLHSSSTDILSFFKALKECFLWALHNASRYCTGEDITNPLPVKLISNILVSLLWQDYFLIGNANSKDKRFQKPDGSAEDVSELLDEQSSDTLSANYPTNYVQELGKCIVGILVDIHSKESSLLSAFSISFHKDSLEMFKHGECLSKFSELVERLSNFFHLLDQYSWQKGQTWPLDYLAGPLVADSFSMIKSMDSPDAVRFLSNLIEIFGPVKLFAYLHSCSKDYCTDTSENGSSETETNLFLQMFRTEFVPWSLQRYTRSSSAKLDLLIDLVQDEDFSEQWCSIIGFATTIDKNMETEISITYDIGQVEVLAIFFEKLRVKLSRMKHNSVQKVGSLPEHWKHKLLDSAAVSIASHSLSTMSCARFLRSVLGGSLEDDRSCFISGEAVISIFEEILKNLVSLIYTSSFEWARLLCPSLVSCESIDSLRIEKSTFDDNLKKAQFSFEVLEGSLFCLKMLGENCILLPRILAVTFILDWECSMSSLISEENFNRSVLPIVAPGTTLGEHYKEQLLQQIDAKLTLGRRMHAFRHKTNSSFWGSFSSTNLSTIKSILVQAVRSAAFERNNATSDQISSLCCDWALELQKVICHDQAELQSLLDEIISEDSSWPFWVAPLLQGESKSAIVQVKKENTCVKDSRHDQFIAFVEKLNSSLGFSTVIGGVVPQTHFSSTSALVERVETFSYSRAWLAGELLCTWRWQGGSVFDSFLPSLRRYAKLESSNPNLLFSTFKILLSGALMEGSNSVWISFDTWTPSDDEVEKIHNPFLRALTSLLSTLFSKDRVWRKHEAVELFELVVDKLFIESTVNRTCLRIIPFVLGIIIEPLLLHSSEFDESSKDVLLAPWKDDLVLKNILMWLERALSFPSLVTGVDKEDPEEWLQLIMSCYPLRNSGEPGTFKVEVVRDINHLEKTLLLNLFQKQRNGSDTSEVRNEMSSASSKQATISSTSTQLILAKLTSILVGYCWREFSEDDWFFVLDSLQSWVESSVLLMEEMAEKIDDIAMNLISKANLELLIEKLERAVLSMDPKPIDISKNALVVLSLSSQFFGLEGADGMDNLQSVRLGKWPQIKDRIMESILRLFFATGVAEAIASSLGDKVSSVITSNRLAYSQFWERLASFVINSPENVRNTAMKSMELWGLSKGPISSLYAILFSPIPIPSLQIAAYRLISTEPFCHLSVLKESCLVGNAYPSLDYEGDKFESSSGESFSLMDEISCQVQKPSSDLLDMDLVSQDRVNFFLAWAILLSYLHSLPPSSQVRESLVQYVQESVSSAILDCIFQSIPLKQAASYQKKKEAELVPETSAAANAAKHVIASGSVQLSLGTLWPLGTEQMASLAGSVYGMMISLLPSYVRNWFTSLRDRSLLSAIETFTKMWCSPSLLSNELSQVKETIVADENFSVSVNKSTYEIVATYKKEETGMDLVIRLPSCYPLRPGDVDCTRSLGISEVKKRKWLLSLTAFIRNQNGAIGEAIRVWKSNLDKEFLGVEECPICYSIIHTTNHTLPRLACKTCKHKFHSACLYKWFSTSHKSTCPLCQTPF